MQQIKLNLLPVEFRVGRKSLTWVFSRRFIWPFLGFIIVVVSCATYWVVLNDEYNSLKDTIANQNKKIETLKPVEKKVKNLKAKIQKIEKKNKALVGIQFSKTRWINIFQDISAVLPSNSWITAVQQVKSNTSLSLKITTYQFSDIAQYMVDLEGRRSFKLVKLRKINTLKTKSVPSFVYELDITLDDEFLSKSFQEVAK